jgi:hypothetical protein
MASISLSVLRVHHPIFNGRFAGALTRGAATSALSNVSFFKLSFNQFDVQPVCFARVPPIVVCIILSCDSSERNFRVRAEGAAPLFGTHRDCGKQLDIVN